MGISYAHKTFSVFINTKLASRSELAKEMWERRRELAKVGPR